MDHYFCDWGRELSNFQNKIMHTNCHGKKNRASVFYYPGPVLHVEKNSCTSYYPSKKIMHSLKVKKKIHGPEIAYYPPPSPQLKKIIGHP